MDLISAFQWFHSHPELSGGEFETSEKLRLMLGESGVEILPLPLETGLVACISGPEPGPVVALRCDIDALPLQEQSGLPYASGNDGCMHACGHDFHTVSMLGAARLLKSRQKTLKGALKLIFQPSEEICSGAALVMSTGALDDVDAIFGLHCIPLSQPGTIFCSEGPGYASTDRFRFRINGVGAHAAYPHFGADPIIAGASIINALQSITSRSVDPMEPCVLSVTHFDCGYAWNTISETAFMEGTLRSFSPQVRSLQKDRIAEILDGAELSFGVKIDREWDLACPALENNGQWSEFVLNCARDLGFACAPLKRSMGGEDFAVYLKSIPGAFYNISTGGGYHIHHPQFTADPHALEDSARLLADIGEKALLKLSDIKA